VTVNTAASTADEKVKSTIWNESVLDNSDEITNLPDVVNKFKYHGEVALYYNSAGFFTVIIIYPYQKLLKITNDSNSTNLKEIFNLNKLMLEDGIKQDSSYSGLIRVIKINNTYTIDLNGTYPENMESRLKHACAWLLILKNTGVHT